MIGEGDSSENFDTSRLATDTAKHLHKRAAKTSDELRTDSDFLSSEQEGDSSEEDDNFSITKFMAEILANASVENQPNVSLLSPADDTDCEISRKMKDFLIQGHTRMLKKRNEKDVALSTKIKSGTYTPDIITAFEKINKAQMESRFQESLEEARTLATMIERYPGEELQNKEDILASAYSLMGDACMEMKRYDEAREIYQRELHLSVENSLDEAILRTILNLENVYARKGEYKQAINTWQELLSTVESVSHRVLINMEIGKFCIQLENHVDAIYYGERSLAAAKESADDESQLYSAGIVAFAEAHLGLRESADDSMRTAIAMAESLGDIWALEVLKKFARISWRLGRASTFHGVAWKRDHVVDYLTHIYHLHGHWSAKGWNTDSAHSNVWTTSKAIHDQIQKTLLEIDGALADKKYEVVLRKSSDLLETLDNCLDLEYLDKQMLKCDIYRGMGSAYFELGDFVRALENHEMELGVATANDLEQAKSRSLFNQGRVHARNGEQREAIDLWQMAVSQCKSPSETALLNFEIGTCYLEMCNYPAVLRKGMQSLDAATKSSDRICQLFSTVLLAQSQVQLGLHNIAAASLRRALKMARDLGDKMAECVLKKALKEVPLCPITRTSTCCDNHVVLENLKGFLFRCYEEMSTKLHRSKIERVEIWKDKCPERICVALVEIDNAYNEGRYNESVKKATETLQILGDLEYKEVENNNEVVSHIYNCIGNAYLRMDDHSQALEFYEKDLKIALENNLEYAELRAILNRGRVYLRRGETLQALYIFMEALNRSDLPLEAVVLHFEIANSTLNLDVLNQFLDCEYLMLHAATNAGNKELKLYLSLLHGTIEVEIERYRIGVMNFRDALDVAKFLENKDVTNTIAQALNIFDIPRYTRVGGRGKPCGARETSREEAAGPDQVTQELTNAEITYTLGIHLPTDVIGVSSFSRNESVTSFLLPGDQLGESENSSDTEVTLNQTSCTSPEETTCVKELYSVPQEDNEDTLRKELHTDSTNTVEETYPKELSGYYIPGRLGPEGQSNPSSFNQAIYSPPETSTYYESIEDETQAKEL